MRAYKKPRRRSGRSRLRRDIIQTAADNQREDEAVTTQSAETGVRARLQDQFPDEAPEEIERRVKRVMAGGLKPTTSTLPPPPGIPADVLADRRAARKKTVKANRRQRRRT